MISNLSGRVGQVTDQHLTVEVGGVGLQVFTPQPLLAEVQRGQVVSLHTYLVVRENELSLYGFASWEARQLFLMLLGVNGVGPRLALAILSALTVETIRAAVGTKRAEVLSGVPGVGTKTAQKIILHLADRITVQPGNGTLAAMVAGDQELLQALTGLGYSVVEAQSALQSLPADAPEKIEERLKLALRYFS
jgi:Holliday junction DNA helicase RuvA